MVVAFFLVLKLINRPYMSFVVKYADIPAVSKNLLFFPIDVHFRGYEVGNVRKIKLAEDQSHIEFFIDIGYKGLKIPTNSLMTFKTENVYGTRYIDIDPPCKQSGMLIKNGDIVDGFVAYERFDQYLIDELATGKSGRIVQNMQVITDAMRKSVENENNEKLLSQSSGDLAIIIENLKKISSDPSFQAGARHSSCVLKSLDEILRQKGVRAAIAEAPASMNKTLSNMSQMNDYMSKVVESIPETSKNMETGNSLMATGNKLVAEGNALVAEGNALVAEGNKEMSTFNKKIPPSLLENAEKLVLKTDCFESEMSKLLSKRNLLLRLIFGHPGKSFKACAKNQCNPSACKKEVAKN